MSTGIEPTITLTDEGDWWTATDTETGVTSQGQTREKALANLDEALRGYRGEGEPRPKRTSANSVSTRKTTKATLLPSRRYSNNGFLLADSCRAPLFLDEI